MYQKRFSGKRSRSIYPKRASFRYPKQTKKSVSIDPTRFVHKAIVTQESDNFIPEHRFEDLVISPILKRNVGAKGYKVPTPIQDRTIPHVLRGQDVVGIANTGTGKTAAFLLPLIDKILINPTEKVLIIVPTRELALQIEKELRDLIRGLNLCPVCVVGGAAIGAQLKALRTKNHFIIGTPGRLRDLIKRGNIKLIQFSTLVLDEADRMLDMGFIEDMRFVAKGMPSARHTLFFSATISREIESLINEFLKQPVRISVKTGETAKNVEQDVVKVGSGKNKVDVLHDLLNQKEFRKVLVFGRTKHGVEKLYRLLIDRGFKAESIHGNKSHSQRQRALKRFKENSVQILVATDVAARGLDIDDVSHVLNYDLPTTYDDYVHRIGRTGRGSKLGKALTFID
ncbi:MAG: RNA helicase [Candidatus Yanofskybacteria bacterium CG10_big_fil_rev_8_21_14_0_10_46_23]|uniref:RNA helicase n=1 Tax=Candidatus Yanofskybacteria bacterium CG10_big_fil_rev_8_21_14_0_10_46_23 TaxID=1975098 RepID=A0A2H0R4J6_9BACT|nr:MAG: RNA helicase [Candidatus Yanofskybacteria bacterium CG10_big_fil_rev_8_21_14_0_10_46_23]